MAALVDPALGLDGPVAALVTCCRRHPSGRLPAHGWPNFATPAFQRALHDAAARHEVLGLVLSSLLTGLGVTGLGRELADGYARTLQLLRRRAALWDLERDFVLARLAGAGIPIVLLKGAALRLTAYPDPVARQFGDIDVLVEPDQVTRAVEALRESGYLTESDTHTRLYVEHHHHLRLHKKSGFLVEIHWALEPPTSPFALDPRTYRSDAVPARGAGTTLVPRAEHMVLHVCTQNVEDGFALLRRLVDVDRIIASAPELEWKRLAAEATRMRVTGPVALSLRLASLLLGAEVPPGFIQSLGLSRTVRIHQAMLDPVHLLLDQRARTRAALARLVFLWSIADSRIRRESFEAMHAGRYDDLWRRLSGVANDGRWSGLARSAKLLSYQGWLWVAWALRWVSVRRSRKFWHGA